MANKKNTNYIVFKLNLKNIKDDIEIDDAILDFFDEIKEEVYEQAKASQKKYFKIIDTFDMVLPEHVDEYYEAREIVESFGPLGESEGEWISEDDPLEKYYRDIACYGWSVAQNSVSHGNNSIKRFNKYYDFKTREIFECADRYSYYSDRNICFVELKFIFTNFCESDWCCEKYNDDGCMCNDSNDSDDNDNNIDD